MVLTKKLLAFCLLFLTTISLGQEVKFNWNKVQEKYGEEIIPFSAPYTHANLEFLTAQNIAVKSITKDYILFSATPTFVNEAYESGELSDFYLEFSNPTALDDTARAILFVDEVHQGVSPLPAGYTGEGVIMAFVDQGLDFTHPDFIDDNGTQELFVTGIKVPVLGEVFLRPTVMDACVIAQVLMMVLVHLQKKALRTVQQ